MKVSDKILRRVKWVMMLFLCLTTKTLLAQQTFPVTVNTFLTPPYSPYVSDIVSPESNFLKANFVFNDFREPSWQVRLKIRIESSEIKLETRPDYKSSVPITVTPGVSVTLTGIDFTEYLDFKNLSILGSGRNSFLQNGRLPEGTYLFCVEVLDYQTGTVLSNTSCASAWIRLNDPPKVITPMCGSFIDPTIPLNIPFQWQLSNGISPNATLGTEYKLILYEVTDLYANPFTAIVNGKVLQIFESESLLQPSFVYNPSFPALDIGKTYVYQIKATDIGGRDLFKNNGLSEVCWFHYGYPENAKVTLISPDPERAFKRNEQTYLRWSAPDVRLINQPFIYEVKVVQLDGIQNFQQAMQSNPLWYSYRTSQVFTVNGLDHIVTKPIRPLQHYAWQVITHSGNQIVSTSEIRDFYGPPLVDKFYAGKHTVVVQKATSVDSLNFSGTGKVKFNATDSILVDFTNLKLKRIVNYWVLTEGEIVKALPTATPITLQPKNSVNGIATFYPKSLRFNAIEYSLIGEVKWQLPHPVKSGEVAYVTSDVISLNYDKFKLLGSAKFSDRNQFALLEPYDFALKLSPDSDFLISEDRFELRAHGTIEFPEKVKGKLKGKVKVSFPRTGQLFYLENLSVAFENDILLAENTRIYLKPTVVTIDLAEDKSPANKISDTIWKGVYFHEYDLQYLSFTDEHAQLLLKKDVTHQMKGEEALATNAWLDLHGLNFSLSKDFQRDEVVFNSFAGLVKHIDLIIERNSISNSKLSGGILVPVFSQEYFDFTAPITNEGFQPGYLNDIDETQYVFNKGAGEQEIVLTVNRGVFVDQRLIDMVIDLEWPAMNIKAEAVSGFKAWGDYRIGFFTPNGGRALDQQLQGTISGYPTMVEAVFAGSGEGMYSFVASAKVQLSSDISGNSGPPAINVYTIMPNSLLPENHGEAAIQQYTDPVVYIQQLEATAAATQQQATQQLNQSEDEIKSKAGELLNSLTGTEHPGTLEAATADLNSTSITPDPTVGTSSGGLIDKLNTRQRTIIKDIIEALVIELTEPLTHSINQIADSVNLMIETEINEIIEVVQEEVHDKVTSLVNSVAGQILNAVDNNQVDLSDAVQQLSDIVRDAIVQEINTSVTSSIRQNIQSPVTTLIKVEIAGRLNNSIHTTATAIIIGTLDGTVKLEDVPVSIVQSADTILHEIGDEVFDLIDFDNLSGMAYHTVNDALKGISTDRIFNEIKSGTVILLESALKDRVNQMAAVAAGQILGDAVGIEIPVDFTTLLSKLKDGEIQDVFALDPVPVKLKTRVLELNGLIHYTNDEPTFGDVWMGDIEVLVKVPKSFGLKAVYINGKKDDLNYWFAQIMPNNNSSVKLGDPIPRKAKELDKPVKMGVAKIVGASGRVYHHMRDAPGKAIVPDPDMNYGAYMNLVFFDQTKNGKIMRLDVSGEINTANNGDYVITFEGDLQLMSKAPKVSDIDPGAAIKGEFKFSYNSAEEHFIGYGRVELLKPGQLCASGSILVDTKPGKWRVELGSREDRIKFVPACAGWSPTGWLMVNQSEAELGLGIQYSIYAQSKTANFVVVKANVALDAGVAFGILAAIRYDPNFALLRAGVWADLWADVVVNYRFFGPFSRWKRFSILSIYAKGDLTVIFEPKPSTLEGKLKGQVRLLSICKVKFKAGFKTKLL